MLSSTYKRKTMFADSDAAGLIHFSRCALYVEEAEHCLLERLGFPVVPLTPGSLRWPRVQFQSNFARGLFPLQMIDVKLVVERVGNASVQWRWSIWQGTHADPAVHGMMKTVCSRVEGNTLTAIPVPRPLREKLLSG